MSCFVEYWGITAPFCGAQVYVSVSVYWRLFGNGVPLWALLYMLNRSKVSVTRETEKVFLPKKPKTPTYTRLCTRGLESSYLLKCVECLDS